MIRYIGHPEEILRNVVTDPFGAKVKALAQVYGGDDRFCRFYQIDGAFAALYDNALILTAPPQDSEELAAFCSVCGVNRVSAPRGEERTLPGWYVLPSHMMAYTTDTGALCMRMDESPALDSVYQVLFASFLLPQAKDAYQMWYAEASHRVRHGIGKAYLLDGACTAYVSCRVDGVAYLAQLATLPQERGRGLAGTLLRHVVARETSSGRELWVQCTDGMRPFYQARGFRRVCDAAEYFLVSRAEGLPIGDKRNEERRVGLDG